MRGSGRILRFAQDDMRASLRMTAGRLAGAGRGRLPLGYDARPEASNGANRMSIGERAGVARVGDAIDRLDTPVVVVDLDVVEANVRSMAEFAKSAGVGLRPHCKTHKTLEI